MSAHEKVVDQILLILDRRPCHGYELRRLLTPVAGDVELTTLYRWLHAMEAEGLVDSEMQAGLHGPSRRIYRVGARGESRLRQVLCDAIGVVLHFYDAYRHFALHEIFEPRLDDDVPQGPVLIGVVSHLLTRDVDVVQFLARRAGNEPLHVLGDPGVWGELKLKEVRVEGTPWDIASRSDRFAEVWLLGTPPRPKVPQTVVEVKRVLRPEGVMRMVAPFVFFSEPEEPNLEAFIRVTASHLFPELNVVEGEEVCALFERHFGRSGVIQFFPGYTAFWGIKHGD